MTQLNPYNLDEVLYGIRTNHDDYTFGDEQDATGVDPSPFGDCGSSPMLADPIESMALDPLNLLTDDDLSDALQLLAATPLSTVQTSSPCTSDPWACYDALTYGSAPTTDPRFFTQPAGWLGVSTAMSHQDLSQMYGEGYERNIAGWPGTLRAEFWTPSSYPLDNSLTDADLVDAPSLEELLSSIEALYGTGPLAHSLSSSLSPAASSQQQQQQSPSPNQPAEQPAAAAAVAAWRFECAVPGCSKKAPRKKDIHRHICQAAKGGDAAHEDERRRQRIPPDELACRVCGKVGRDDNIRRHERNVHRLESGATAKVKAGEKGRGPGRRRKA